MANEGRGGHGCYCCELNCTRRSPARACVRVRRQACVARPRACVYVYVFVYVHMRQYVLHDAGREKLECSTVDGGNLAPV